MRYICGTCKEWIPLYLKVVIYIDLSLFFFLSSVNVENSLNFEIESQIDLGINPKLCKYPILYVCAGTEA